MSSGRLTKLLLVGLFSLLGILFTTNLYAVELNGNGMGPSTLDKTVKPGDSFEQEFNVWNRTDVPVKVQPYIQDYRIENNHWYKVKNPDTRWSPMTWATIVSTPTNLKTGEYGKIRVRFDIPSNAEMGEHVSYFTGRFAPVIAETAGEKSALVAVVSEIRSFIYIKVTDANGMINLKPAWQIQKAGIKFWNFGTPVSFVVKAANTGNVHLEVRGKIVFTDLIRNQKIRLDMPVFNVLPGTDKEINIPWQEAPFIGYFRGNMELSYDGVHFEKRSFSFIIIPLFTLLGILAAIAAIILAVALYIRRLQKRLWDIEQRLNNKS